MMVSMTDSSAVQQKLHQVVLSPVSVMSVNVWVDYPDQSKVVTMVKGHVDSDAQWPIVHSQSQSGLLFHVLERGVGSIFLTKPKKKKKIRFRF